MLNSYFSYSSETDRDELLDATKCLSCVYFSFCQSRGEQKKNPNRFLVCVCVCDSSRLNFPPTGRGGGGLVGGGIFRIWAFSFSCVITEGRERKKGSN